MNKMIDLGQGNTVNEYQKNQQYKKNKKNRRERK